MNLLGAAPYPGQVLYLYVRSDAGIAFLLAILHIPQVENTSDYVQQLLCREDTEREKQGQEKSVKDRKKRTINRSKEEEIRERRGQRSKAA